MTKINLKKIFFLLTFFSFYLTYSQTYIDEIVNSVEFVNKNKLLNVLLDPTSKGLSSPFLPIYVENNQKIEKVIVSNIDLFNYYSKKNINNENNNHFIYDYIQFVKNLIYNKDTLEIDTFFLNNFNNDGLIYQIPDNHYIFQYNDSLKYKVIEAYFNSDGTLKEDSISLIAPLVSKLIEWSHFIEKADGYETYFTLYDYRKYYPQNDLEIIILHSLSLFLQQIYNSEYVYIINDFFPKNINISIEQLNIGNHSCSLIDLPKQNDKSIKNFNIVILEGIVIKDNLLSLKYSYSILDYSKEKSHILSTKKLSYDFSYNYSEYDQVWQFVNMTKINE